MGKILLTKKNIDQYISKDKNNVYIDKDMILTPSAKDAIRNLGKVIVYGKEPKENGNTVKKKVVEILKINHNIKDNDEVNKICSIVLNKINKK